MTELTGETWLKQAERTLAPMFAQAGLTIPDNVRYAVAFPSAGARANTIGECWYAAASSDNRHTIIIRADQSNTINVLGILIHELLHASLPPGTGHGPVFKRHMDKLYLAGPATATSLTFDGRVAMDRLMREGYSGIGSLPPLRDCPWGKLRFDTSLVSDRPKPQNTRMLKATCPDCGYLVRLTKQWAAKGLPSCPTDGSTFTLECD